MKSENPAHSQPQTLVSLLAQLDSRGTDSVTRAIEIEDFLMQRATENGVPIVGKFELTPLCNLDCKMCYIHLQKSQMGNASVLNVAAWKNLMKQAADAGMLMATLTGGECLTYPDFEELYLYLQTLGVQVMVFTNGVRITEREVLFFKEHPPKLIQITLYGSSEDAYEAVTGHRQFRRVMDAITMLKAAEVPLRIAITPNRFMGDDGPAILRLANSLEVPYQINASLFDPYEETGRKGQALDLNREIYADLYELRAKLQGKSLQSGELKNLPLYTSVEDEGRGVRCGAGRRTFVLTWDGRMQPCSMLRDIQQFPLEIGFSDAWQAIHAEVTRYLRPVECETCAYQAVCAQCVAEHAKGAPVGHANRLICARTKNLFERGILSL